MNRHFVDELHRFADLPLDERAGRRVHDAHDAVRQMRGAAKDLAGLGEDRAEHLGGRGQAVPAPDEGVRDGVPRRRDLGLHRRQDLLRRPLRGRRPLRNGRNDRLDLRAGGVGPPPTDFGDLQNPPVNAPGPVPKPLGGVHPRGRQAADGLGHDAHPIFEEPAVRGVVDVTLHHRRVLPPPPPANQGPPLRLLRQHVIQRVDDLRAELLPKFDQRRGVRDLGVQRDVAEPPPLQVVPDFREERLVTHIVQPAQHAQAHKGGQGDRRAAARGRKVFRERGQDGRVVQAGIPIRQGGGEGHVLLQKRLQEGQLGYAIRSIHSDLPAGIREGDPEWFPWDFPPLEWWLLTPLPFDTRSGNPFIHAGFRDLHPRIFSVISR